MVRVAAGMALPLALGGCVGGTTSEGGNTDANAAQSAASQPTSGAAVRTSDKARRYDLDKIPTSTVAINDATFRVWLAQDFDPRWPGLVQEGLMHVPTAEIADDQGMLFVFSDERVRGFWMRNTIAPLDIAFARFDGTIVAVWQMPPLTLELFSSIEPAMFALEVKQGTFGRLGIKEGDKLVYPPDVFQVRE